MTQPTLRSRTLLYKLITEAQASSDLPDNQYVTVEVRVGIPEIWTPEIAGGLGSRLIDRQSQNMTVAARATAERKVFAHLS